MPKRTDAYIENHGTIYLLRPVTKRAKVWIEENVASEGWQWFGNALTVEHRLIHPLAEGMRADGFNLKAA